MVHQGLNHFRAEASTFHEATNYKHCKHDFYKKHNVKYYNRNIDFHNDKHANPYAQFDKHRFDLKPFVVVRKSVKTIQWSHCTAQ